MTSSSGSRAHHDAAALTQHYEELRGGATRGVARGPMRGLAVLLRDGMAAWMDICVQCPAPQYSDSTKVADNAQDIVDSLSSTVINLLADMALTRILEVHV